MHPFHYRQGNYRFHKGATKILSARVFPIITETEEVKKIDDESMDTSS